MGKKTLLAGILVCLAAAIAVGTIAWRARQRAAILAAALPDRPDLSAWAPELAARITSCETRVRERTDPISALGELSRLYHANGFLPEASHCYGALTVLDPANGRWAYRDAIILSGFGENEPAIERLRQVPTRPVDYVPARLRLGETLLKVGNIDDAIGVYRAILETHPKESYALLGLARCDIERERWQDAREKLERLVDQTNYMLGYDLIVSVYERLGETARAAAIRGQMRAWGAFRDMLDPWMEELLEDSYDPYQLSLASGAAARRPDHALALRRLERAITLAPETAALRFQLASLLLERKEYVKAREQFERCTQLAPKFADGWAHLSGLLATVGDRAGADRILEEGLRNCPDSPGLHMMNGHRLKRIGRLEEAIAEYRRSIELRPTEADAYIELGTTLIGAGRSAEGISVLESALVAEPQHPFIVCTLALHAIEQRDEAAARKWIEQARLQPRVKPVDMKQVTEAYSATFGRRAP
ncbi:MAG: tetratricopeptide repeat protein [Opitutaceae bacterium]|nr:tetratricopeptide repeat protein [Opitutaceae bacterium]